MEGKKISLILVKILLLVSLVVAIIFKFLEGISEWLDVVFIIYFVLFTFLLIITFSEFMIKKTIIISQYFAFLHYNVGYGSLGCFVGLITVATPFSDVSNIASLMMAIIGCILIILGFIFENYVIHDLPEESAHHSTTSSKKEKTKLKDEKIENEKIKGDGQEPSTSIPGQNKLPAPIF